MRLDLALIARLIAPNSRVLDIGCGDGALIDHLFHAKSCDARGIELDMRQVAQALAHGLPVMQGDADQDLAQFPDQSFDYVVLSGTLPAVQQPRQVLRHMLRIGRHAVVSFPNFGHWRVRAGLALGGRMPVMPQGAKPWHDSPNIHPCTILDFDELCRRDGYRIDHWQAIAAPGRGAPRSLFWANLLARQALFLLTRHDH